MKEEERFELGTYPYDESEEINHNSITYEKDKRIDQGILEEEPDI